MNNQVSILQCAAAFVAAFSKGDEDSNQFRAMMTMCKKNDGDDENDEIGGPGRGNV